MLSSGVRRRALAVVLVGLGGLAAAASPWSAVAQTAPGFPFPTSSTTAPPESTTTAPPETTTTTEAQPPILGPGPTSTTTTTSPPPPSPTPPGDDPPPPSPTTGDGGAAPGGAGPFPPELQALTNSVVRSAANNTRALLAALAPLQQYGLTETQAAIVGFGRFPIAGLASYSHDWWFPRYGPGWRLHQGTDIFAAFGTPVRAPVDGTVKLATGGIGGVTVYVVEPDGTYWYLAHLAATAEGLVTGDTVKTGDVVGFVGDSGNATGGPPHVHIQIHPGGGGPIDPKAVLDQFIADAVALAPQVVDAYARAQQTGAAPAEVAPAPAAVVDALPHHAALLWTTAVNPSGGTARFAAEEATHVAQSIDWSAQPRSSGPTAFDRQLARQYAVWWVQPLVHPRLARLLSVTG